MENDVEVVDMPELRATTLVSLAQLAEVPE
jgi:hypothetical protein